MIFSVYNKLHNINQMEKKIMGKFPRKYNAKLHIC